MLKGIKSEIKFGTDGWRGVISDNFTFKNVKIAAQAISQWVKKDLKPRAGQKRIALGYDARFLSKEYAESVATVLAKNGIKVYLSDCLIPTPALSYGVVKLKAVAGVMITASHNPAKFNGIKIKTFQGGGAGIDITDKIEAYLGKIPVKEINFEQAIKEKKIILRDYKKAYLSFIKKYIDLKRIKKANFKVVQDVMHGSGRNILREVLKGTGIRLTYLRGDINPSFGGMKPEPVIEFLGEVVKIVKQKRFDLGLVLDGDADRIAAVASGGEFIHPQKILGLLTLHLARNRGRKGGVIKTICGTTMIDNIARKLNLKLYETPVGFKYISDLMIRKRIVAGGEEAGGMGVQDYIPERDGNLAGLLLLEMMVYEKRNIRKIIKDMEKEFGQYYYERFDIKLGEGKADLDSFCKKKALLGKKVVDIKDFDGVKLICEDESWLMLRPSGTEPLVRAYSEARTSKRAKALIRYGEQLLTRK